MNPYMYTFTWNSPKLMIVSPSEVVFSEFPYKMVDDSKSFV